MSNSTINAVGYSWITNSKDLPPAKANPQMNMWLPSNVSNPNNELQLTLAQNSGQYYYNNQGVKTEIWAAAQAVLDIPAGSSLKYGKVVATVVPIGGWGAFIGGCTKPNQNTTTIFGIFTFDPAAAKPYGEIDLVEIGYQDQNQADGWINQQTNGPTDSNAQFVVQPWDSGNPNYPNWNNTHRIALEASKIPASNEVTFLMDWQEDSIQYYAAYGSFTSANFPYTDADTITWTLPASIAVPAPTATMSMYVNLWPYGGPSTGETTQFKITQMEIPLTNS